MVIVIIPHFHAFSVNLHVLPANATSVLGFLEKFYVCKYKNRRRKHQTDRIKKVVKTSKFVQGWGIGLNFPQVAMFADQNNSVTAREDVFIRQRLCVTVVFAY